MYLFGIPNSSEVKKYSVHLNAEAKKLNNLHNLTQ